MTYTEDDLKAAVAEAVAIHKLRIAELEAQHEEAALEERIEAATKDLREQVAALTGERDKAVATAHAAEQKLQEVLAYLEAEQAAAEQAAAFAARRQERVDTIRKAGLFPEDYVEAHADRWAEMSDEGFQAALRDWQLAKELATKAQSESKEAAADPSTRPVSAGVEQATQNEMHPSRLMREILDLGLQGVNFHVV